MREFFRRWKRKVGCVTLVLACVFMAGWARSTVVADFLTLSNREFVSIHGAMIVRIAGSDAPAITAFESVVLKGTLDEIDYDDEWEWLRGGFGYRSFYVMRITKGIRSTSKTFDYRVPYWSVVVPLTLLSAWLLLSKPRAATATNQPAESDGPQPTQNTK